MVIDSDFILGCKSNHEIQNLFLNIKQVHVLGILCLWAAGNVRECSRQKVSNFSGTLVSKENFRQILFSEILEITERVSIKTVSNISGTLVNRECSGQKVSNLLEMVVSNEKFQIFKKQ